MQNQTDTQKIGTLRSMIAELRNTTITSTACEPRLQRAIALVQTISHVREIERNLLDAQSAAGGADSRHYNIALKAAMLHIEAGATDKKTDEYDEWAAKHAD